MLCVVSVSSLGLSPFGCGKAGVTPSFMSKAVALPVFRNVRFMAVELALLDSNAHTTNGLDVIFANADVSTARTRVTRQSASVARAVTSATATCAAANMFSLLETIYRLRRVTLTIPIENFLLGSDMLLARLFYKPCLHVSMSVHRCFLRRSGLLIYKAIFKQSKGSSILSIKISMLLG